MCCGPTHRKSSVPLLAVAQTTLLLDWTLNWLLYGTDIQVSEQSTV